MSANTYKKAGLDLDLNQQAMRQLPALLQKTHSSRVLDLPGGFAGLFRLNGDGHSYRDPILVSGTDGVGTKIQVAIRAGNFETIGIDLVAMCVNDCLCLGAEPLFLLDYIVLGQDDPDLVAQLVGSISEGCSQAGLALLGGETAIHPGEHPPGHFDLAGFCIGVVERDRIIDGSAIRSGDVVLGLESSGFHSNGYSLIRKVVLEYAGLTIQDPVPASDNTVGQALLEPTSIYVTAIHDVLADDAGRAGIHGMAHITGGGLPENLERILPPQCRITINPHQWEPSPLFEWLQRLGDIETDEMFRVFNMGIGFVLVVDPSAVANIQQILKRRHVQSWIIGEVTSGERGVEFVH